jgi:hypothetical protein
MADLKIIETGDGGDAVLLNNDLVIIEGFQNMPYLGMFGGNIEESTSGPKQTNQQSFDWWANSLLMPNDNSIQFNSLLEKTLKTVSLTPSGRLQIINVIKDDLSFFKSFSTISIDATIVSVDRIEINIKIQEPDNLESNDFTYIWDSTNQELTSLK